MNTPTPRPNGRQKIQIAERAAVGLRSVDAYFDGTRRQNANTVEHIARAIRELGWPELVRETTAVAS